MAAPTTAEEICSLALGYIGEPGIEGDITAPVTKNEQLCAQWYDIMRQGLLREYVWNFAQKYATVARQGNGAGGYADAYLVPSDCLRVLGFGEDHTIGMNFTDFQMTNESGGTTINVDNSGGSLYIRYILDEDDPTRFDPLFTDLLALKLAEVLAYAITKKKTVRENVTQMISLKLPKAISVDGQERPPVRVQRSRYLNARYGVVTDPTVYNFS